LQNKISVIYQILNTSA